MSSQSHIPLHKHVLLVILVVLEVVTVVDALAQGLLHIGALVTTFFTSCCIWLCVKIVFITACQNYCLMHLKNAPGMKHDHF